MFLALVAFALAGSIALAYTYRATYVVTNNTTTNYTMLGVSTNSSNQWMADNGFMGSSALDTRIETLSGVLKPHMVAENRTQVAIPVPASSQTNLFFTTGNSDLTYFPTIVGYSGNVTVSDNETIELGNQFIILVDGYVNTDNGSDKNIIFKDSAFRLFVSPTVSGNVTASITGGASVTALNVLSGEHLIEVSANVTHLRIYIDTVLRESKTIGASVPDNGNIWTFFQGNVMPYVEYLRFWT